MVRSLREFGGKFAKLPVIACIGRFGAPLSLSTVHALKELDVELVYAPRGANLFSWFNYANKVVAVTLANRMSKTGTIAWIDSDVLFAGEPHGLMLSNNEDFAARCEPIMPSVVSGQTKNLAYWIELCRVTCTDFDELIWLDQGDKPAKIMYFNSGIFVWRKSSVFAETYASAFTRLLRSRIAQEDGSFFAADQIILNGVVTQAKLRWRHMRMEDHHIIFPGMIEGEIAAPHIGKSAILHYSGSLSGPYRAMFLKRLEKERPGLATWLASTEQQTVVDHKWHDVALAKSLKIWRGLQWRLFEQRVIRIRGELDT
jgi:hypothetical protein